MKKVILKKVIQSKFKARSGGVDGSVDELAAAPTVVAGAEGGTEAPIYLSSAQRLPLASESFWNAKPLTATDGNIFLPSLNNALLNPPQFDNDFKRQEFATMLANLFGSLEAYHRNLDCFLSDSQYFLSGYSIVYDPWRNSKLSEFFADRNKLDRELECIKDLLQTYIRINQNSQSENDAVKWCRAMLEPLNEKLGRIHMLQLNDMKKFIASVVASVEQAFFLLADNMQSHDVETAEILRSCCDVLRMDFDGQIFCHILHEISSMFNSFIYEKNKVEEFTDYSGENLIDNFMLLMSDVSSIKNFDCDNLLDNCLIMQEQCNRFLFVTALALKACDIDLFRKKILSIHLLDRRLAVLADVYKAEQNPNLSISNQILVFPKLSRLAINLERSFTALRKFSLNADKSSAYRLSDREIQDCKLLAETISSRVKNIKQVSSTRAVFQAQSTKKRVEITPLADHVPWAGAASSNAASSSDFGSINIAKLSQAPADTSVHNCLPALSIAIVRPMIREPVVLSLAAPSSRTSNNSMLQSQPASTAIAAPSTSISSNDLVSRDQFSAGVRRL